MNLLSLTAADARVAEIFGPGFAADLRAAAACIDRNRLREITPIAWAKPQHEYEDISHDCA